MMLTAFALKPSGERGVGFDTPAPTHSELMLTRPGVGADGASIVGQDGVDHTGQTGSAAFKAWFGASQVVDAAGLPLVVYRGVRQQIGLDAYDARAGRQYFTDDRAVARAYSMQNDGAAGTVVDAYLRIARPFDLVDDKAAHALAKLMNVRWTVQQAYYDLTDAPGLEVALSGAGYDGVRMDDSDGNVNHQTFIVFAPSQIKSATANNGAYDPASNMVRRDAGDGAQRSALQRRAGGHARSGAGLRAAPGAPARAAAAARRTPLAPRRRSAICGRQR